MATPSRSVSASWINDCWIGFCQGVTKTVTLLAFSTLHISREGVAVLVTPSVCQRFKPFFLRVCLYHPAFRRKSIRDADTPTNPRYHVGGEPGTTGRTPHRNLQYHPAIGGTPYRRYINFCIRSSWTGYSSMYRCFCLRWSIHLATGTGHSDDSGSRHTDYPRQTDTKYIVVCRQVYPSKTFLNSQTCQ